MTNPMNPQMIQQIKGIMNQIKMAQNPQLALNQILMNNPNINLIMELIKNNGGNLQTAFYNLAKQKGIDPQVVLNELQK